MCRAFGRVGLEGDAGTFPTLARLELHQSGSGFNNTREDAMIKQVLAGVAAIGTISGAALAQTYITASPPPSAGVPGSVGVPGSTKTTTTISPTTDHATTVTEGVDANGNKITKEDKYREGIAGSSESHTTVTDPD